MCLSTTSRRICSLIFPGETHFQLFLLKNGVKSPLFCSAGTSIDFSNMMESGSPSVQEFLQLQLILSDGLLHLEELPGLLVPCCVVPPASAGVVEDPQACEAAPACGGSHLLGLPGGAACIKPPL